MIASKALSQRSPVRRFSERSGEPRRASDFVHHLCYTGGRVANLYGRARGKIAAIRSANMSASGGAATSIGKICRRPSRSNSPH